MYLRLFHSVVLLVTALVVAGCHPPENQDERSNQFFMLGRQRVSAKDYAGAMEMFEKALEKDPRSVLAHFELAMLYEQHSACKESDYVNAMYHYQQAIRYRPSEHPADLARQRISACKRELVKAESLAPVAQGLILEFDRVKEENNNLKKQLESLKAQSIPRPPSPNSGGAPAPVGTAPTPTQERPGNVPAPVTVGGTRVTPLPPTTAKSHTVKPRETLYAIARKYSVRVDQIVAANPNVNPSRLKAGTVLAIP